MPMQPPPVPEPQGSPPLARRVDPPPNPPGMTTNELAESAVPLSIWQHPFIQDVLPFLTSFSLHLGLIVLGLLLLRATELVRLPAHVEQIIIPDAEMVNNGPEGGIPHPGLGGDPTRDAAQDKFPDVPKDSKGLAEKPGPALQISLLGGGAGEDSSPSIISIGPGGLGKGAGVGAGVGTGFGSGAGDGTGQLAPFGVPGGGGGIGPKSNFIGLGGNARKIIYICDASGSMMSKFDSLKVELRNTIDSLKPVQAFNVIFFSGIGPVAADKASLIIANPGNKRKVFDFLDVATAQSSSNPIPALEMAFKQGPELIYLLTDGDFGGLGNDITNQDVIDFCKRRTKDGKVKINTIAFITKESKDNPQDLEFVKALKEIAKNSGGKFKHVSDDDLGQN